MSAPLVLAAWSALGTSVLAGLHDRPRGSATVAFFATAVAGLFALIAPLDQALQVFGVGVKLAPEFELLGRRLVLDGSNRAAVGFLYAIASFLFAAAWLTERGRYFYSAGTLMTGALVASLMVRPFLYAAVFLEVAAMAAVLLLAPPHRPGRAGAQRLLVFYTLAMTAVLTTGWLLETSGVTGAAPVEVQRITRLLGLGFAILLFVPPFHLWLPRAADRGDPYSLAFVAVALHSAGYFFLLEFLDAYEWLRVSSDVAFAMRAGGGALVMAGALWAMAQDSMARTGAFILLADLGVSLLVAGRGTGDAYALGLGLAGARAVGAVVWALGAGVLERAAGGLSREHLKGAAYSNPLPTAAMLVGLFSLAGVPLTAGFPGRWGAIGTFGKAYVLAATGVVFAMLVCAAACARWLRTTLRSPREAPATPERTSWERLYLLAGMTLCVVLGLFPQIIYPWVFQAVSGLTSLISGP